MSRHARSDRDQIIYQAYDGRAVSRETIDLALKAIEARERRRARMQQLRTWLLVAVLVLVLVGATLAVVWWRLT